MSGAHTAGPWLAHKQEIVTLAGAVSLAAVHVNDDIIDAPQTEANARLIAAAPELLKALELAIFYADKRGAMPTAGQWEVLDRHFRAAIAKATQP